MRLHKPGKSRAVCETIYIWNWPSPSDRIDQL